MSDLSGSEELELSQESPCTEEELVEEQPMPRSSLRPGLSPLEQVRAVSQDLDALSVLIDRIADHSPPTPSFRSSPSSIRCQSTLQSERPVTQVDRQSGKQEGRRNSGKEEAVSMVKSSKPRTDSARGRLAPPYY